MEGGLCVGLSDLETPIAGMTGISPPHLEPAMPLEGRPKKSISKRKRKRRRSVFGLRRKPGNRIRLPTDPTKKRFRPKSVFYILVPKNPPEKQGEHEQPLQGDTSSNAGREPLSQTEAQPSPGNLTSPAAENPPEKQGEHEQPLQGDTSSNAGREPALSQTEAQPSPGNLTSPAVVARSSRVIKIPKRFLDLEDDMISWSWWYSYVMGNSRGKQSVESSKLSPGSSHLERLKKQLSQYKGPGGKRWTKAKSGRSTRDKNVDKVARMRRSMLRRREELKKPTVLVIGANVTAAGTVSTETREQAVNYSVNIKREDGGGGEGMVDLLSNIKREDGCGGEGMVMLDAENIKREDGGGGEEMVVLDAKNIKREDEDGGEEMVVDPGNIKRENWGADEEIVVVVDAENIKQELEDEEEESEEDEHCDEGMVVVVVEDAENIKREDGSGGEEMVVVVKQGDISHRVNLSNKRMLHLLKRAKVQLIKVDQQKQLKSSQQTVHRQNLCIDRQCICKDCSMVFHGPAQLHNHRLSLHPQTKWTAP